MSVFSLQMPWDSYLKELIQCKLNIRDCIKPKSLRILFENINTIFDYFILSFALYIHFCGVTCASWERQALIEGSRTERAALFIKWNVCPSCHLFTLIWRRTWGVQHLERTFLSEHLFGLPVTYFGCVPGTTNNRTRAHHISCTPTPCLIATGHPPSEKDWSRGEKLCKTTNAWPVFTAGLA